MMQLHGVAEVECLFLHTYLTAGTIQAIKAAADPTTVPITSTISSLLGGVEVVGGLMVGVEGVSSPFTTSYSTRSTTASWCAFEHSIV